MLGDSSLAHDPRFVSVTKRAEHRADTNAKVAAGFARHDVAELTEKLAANDIAFGRLNDSMTLSQHPHLRRITVGTPTGPVSMPAPAPLRAGEERTYGAIPALGEHSETIRREFAKA